MQHEVSIRAGLVESLHTRASEDILFAVKNPVFVQYFELPETRAGNRYDENGVLQFTPQQSVIKHEIEQWIYAFQNKFKVDETCVIHDTGQEHARLVLGGIAPDEDLSSTEESTPFFAPSFQMEKNQVYVQSPYVSPDTERWVFAYTTPIVLADGSKPAFYHFEMPIEIFQNLVTADSGGRIYVVDKSGLLFADSGHKYDNRPYSSTFGTLPSDFFHTVDSISDSTQLFKIVESASALSPGDAGVSSYVTDGEYHYVAFQELPTFDWILVYDKPYSLMLEGDTSLPQLGTEIAVVSSVIGGAAIILAFLMSSHISRPIRQLASALRSQEIGALRTVNIRTSTDEVFEVTNAVNDMIDRVNKLDKDKAEFGSMMAHELKTPLTPILGFCQALKNPGMMGGELNPTQDAAVEAIHRSAKRLQTLVGDLLDAQKLEIKKMKFKIEDIVAKDLVETVKTNFQDSMAEKHILFLNSSDKSSDIVIRSDRNRLEQVFNNLIVNAIDFVSEHGGRIEIGFQQDVGQILFYVKDNGIGIPSDKLKRLFTRFYQVDTSLTRKHGGSGLGLAICRGIVESLGGKIWVESEPGKGAVFYFTIPDKNPNTNKERAAIA